MKIKPEKKMLYCTEWPKGFLMECTVVKHERDVSDIQIWVVKFKETGEVKSVIDCYLFDYPDTLKGGRIDV